MNVNIVMLIVTHWVVYDAMYNIMETYIATNCYV